DRLCHFCELVCPDRCGLGVPPQSTVVAHNRPCTQVLISYPYRPVSMSEAEVDPADRVCAPATTYQIDSGQSAASFGEAHGRVVEHDGAVVDRKSEDLAPTGCDLVRIGHVQLDSGDAVGDICVHGSLPVGT